jgi:hypothetical protein
MCAFVKHTNDIKKTSVANLASFLKVSFTNTLLVLTNNKVMADEFGARISK